MLLSAKKIYIHKRTGRRVAIVDLREGSLRIRYIRSGHGAFYFLDDFVKYFILLE
jgi:hypothetical protein